MKDVSLEGTSHEQGTTLDVRNVRPSGVDVVGLKALLDQADVCSTTCGTEGVDDALIRL
jgi:hypothetical protein